MRNKFECPRTKIRNGLISKIARSHSQNVVVLWLRVFLRRLGTSRMDDNWFDLPDPWEPITSKRTKRSAKKTSFVASRFAARKRRRLGIGCDNRSDRPRRHRARRTRARGSRADEHFRRNRSQERITVLVIQPLFPSVIVSDFGFRVSRFPLPSRASNAGALIS
ncbi:MAG: hypothetical protein QOF80_2313 [Verrucomicrobiota bacterium]